MYDPFMNPTKDIKTKADALHFAIIVTMKHNGCGEPYAVNYDEAKKLYDFFCANAEFPEDGTNKAIEELTSVMKALAENVYSKPAPLHDSIFAMGVSGSAAKDLQDEADACIRHADFRPRTAEG